MNARLSGEANPRPDFLSLTELDSRGQKVGRENCKLEKRMSGTTQGLKQNLRDGHLGALTVPRYCPSHVRMKTLVRHEVTTNRRADIPVVQMT